MARQAAHSIGAAGSAPRSDEPHARIRELEAALARSETLAQRAQERAAHWERLFDAITDPIGVVSADSRLLYVNEAYRALFGREPDGVSGHECFATYPTAQGGPGHPCDTCPVPAAIRSRRPAFVQTERAQGTEPEVRRIFQRWTYPVVEPDGHIEDVVEMIKDVTEHERLREASRQAEALREADQLKAVLLGTVSHELRSPLAAIKGYAGTLLRHDGRLPRAERHEFLTAISEASDRLESIIDKLLLMSQLETRLIGVSRAPVDLRQLAREAITGVERRLPRALRDATTRHRFVVMDHTGTEASDGVLPVVEGDRRLLRQALDEVLDNAVKYSPDGGLIELSLSRVPPATAAVIAGDSLGIAPTSAMFEICVRDDGLGIPGEHLDHIFDRFHRGDSRLTSEFGGLGLGLAICKRVIELHGGHVLVASTPGRGTEFSLLLPQGDGAGRDSQAPDARKDG
ncbi:MAG: ATP-binding protein [Ktedonobacterales bacterium]